jgi:hypothetical protein
MALTPKQSNMAADKFGAATPTAFDARQSDKNAVASGPQYAVRHNRNRILSASPVGGHGQLSNFSFGDLHCGILTCRRPLVCCLNEIL